MFRLKKILFPVDFSERCRGAIGYVEAMAGRFDAELILLHVVEPPSGTGVLEEMRGPTPESFDNFLGPDLKLFRAERVVTHGEGRGDRRSRAFPTGRFDHDADKGPWRFSAAHLGINCRQGSARRGLPGMDRRPPGDCATTRRSRYTAYSLRRGSTTSKRWCPYMGRRHG